MNVAKEGWADQVYCLDGGFACENAYVLVYDNCLLEIKKDGLRMWAHMMSYEVMWENPVKAPAPNNVKLLKGGSDGGPNVA